MIWYNWFIRLFLFCPEDAVIHSNMKCGSRSVLKSNTAQTARTLHLQSIKSSSHQNVEISSVCCAQPVNVPIFSVLFFPRSSGSAKMENVPRKVVWSDRHPHCDVSPYAPAEHQLHKSSVCATPFPIIECTQGKSFTCIFLLHILSSDRPCYAVLWLSCLCILRRPSVIYIRWYIRSSASKWRGFLKVHSKHWHPATMVNIPVYVSSENVAVWRYDELGMDSCTPAGPPAVPQQRVPH